MAHPTIVDRLRWLGPAAAAMSYPFLLDEFHLGVSAPAGSLSTARIVGAALCLLAAMVVPIIGLASAYLLTNTYPSLFELRARRLAYITIGVPPFFVLTGVAPGLLHLHVNDDLLWVAGWLVLCVYVLLGNESIPDLPAPRPVSRLRAAHGIAAALLVTFVMFHLSNHLLGLVGPDLHASAMRAGRGVYRSHLVEPVLVGLMLFQVMSGARLSWRWSGVPGDAYRVFQIGSGIYLAAFIVTHLNSALVSARAVHKIDTGWAWASGAPAGLIHDAWNIRLLPHYAFGVFFVLAHLGSGLRGVAIAHDMTVTVANRLWIAGLVVSGLISVAIMSGLCGVRI